MSTPTANLIDPFAQGLHETHDRAGPEHPPLESDSEPIRSPYAPARAGERTNGERHPEENDHDPLRSPYAPKKTRTQPVQGADNATPQSVSLWNQQHEQPAAGRRDASIQDLQRLEATIRGIQREAAAARIPRAAQLPPVLGLAPVNARGRRHGGEILDFPAPRWLEPQRMGPPPPTIKSRRHKLRAPLIILIASILAVPSGYYFWTGGWRPFSQPEPGPQMASLATKTDALSSFIGQKELPRVMARDDEGRDDGVQDNDRGMSAQGKVSSQRSEASQPARSSEGETMAMLQPSATTDQAPPSSKAIRVLDPEEIKLLLKQGEQFIAVGDVATARTVLQRAAEAGNASAAMALGATYDPNVLAKLGVVGVSADVEKARSWYQKAENLGSPPPQVLIYRSASGYKMKVESSSQAVWAERLQRPMREE
jgi:hypothetical protein